MNKKQITTIIKLETYEKLNKLKKESRLNIGQLIDLMTSKQKVVIR